LKYSATKRHFLFLYFLISTGFLTKLQKLQNKNKV